MVKPTTATIALIDTYSVRKLTEGAMWAQYKKNLLDRPECLASMTASQKDSLRLSDVETHEVFVAVEKTGRYAATNPSKLLGVLVMKRRTILSSSSAMSVSVIFVVPANRRLGIGRALWNTACDVLYFDKCDAPACETGGAAKFWGRLPGWRTSPLDEGSGTVSGRTVRTIWTWRRSEGAEAAASSDRDRPERACGSTALTDVDDVAAVSDSDGAHAEASTMLQIEAAHEHSSRREDGHISTAPPAANTSLDAFVARLVCVLCGAAPVHNAAIGVCKKCQYKATRNRNRQTTIVTETCMKCGFVWTGNKASCQNRRSRCKPSRPCARMKPLKSLNG